MSEKPKLGTGDHRRDVEGMRWVYPVVSRRARGVSVGVNLNPNNACNWRCIYCQVPELSRGKAPEVDLQELDAELGQLLEDIVHGDFLERRVPEDARRLNDVALSGNGEPTSCERLAEVLEVIGRRLDAVGQLGQVKVVLITNGSLVGQPEVQAALRTLATMNGEVWFKLDRATREGLAEVNDTPLDPERHLERLRLCAGLCPTWVQACFFARDGRTPPDAEVAAWLEALAGLVRDQVPLRGVQLYGLARPSLQPEAPGLAKAPREWMEALAAEVESLGLTVDLHA